MPVYNAKEYIKEAIESVIRQSLKEVDIICVNDGSKDNSLQIIEDYAKRDDRISYITTENQGAGKARNLGIKMAKGKYLFFLDPDDYLYSDFVFEKLYNAAEKNHVFICGGGCCFDREGKLVIERDVLLHNFSKDGMVKYKNYQRDYFYWRFLYNRKMILENDLLFPDYRRYQDPPFMVKAMAHCGEFMAIQDIVYCYRKSSKPVVWTKEKCIGVLKGVRDEVILSKRMHYDNLYLELFKRMAVAGTHDAIVQAATVYHCDEVEESLDQIRACIDITLLKENTIKLDNSVWKLIDYSEEEGYPKSFLEAMRSPQGIILYGAGIVGERMVQQFKLKYWDNVIGFAVSDNKGEKNEICNIPIFQIDQLLKYREVANVFVSTSPSLHREIKENLKRKGFKNIYLIDWAELKKSVWF